MSRAVRSRSEGYTLGRALADVFRRPPAWPWSVVAWIGIGGLVGAVSSSLFTPAGGVPHPALRWAACAGYGMVAAALVAVLPRAGQLVGLRASLAKRPADEGHASPWWPLQLLAAALRGTPGGRRTQQEFDASVNAAWPAARSILAHRFWPAWVAAFVVPVLGLLSAWEAGKQIEIVAGQDASDVLRQFVPQVSPPMVATIAAALVLMVVLAILDQLTSGLLERWSTVVRFTDGVSPVVLRLLDEPPPPSSSDGRTELRDPAASPSDPVTEAVAKGPTPDDLDALGEALSNRGRGA